jgi:hypothetical protein
MNKNSNTRPRALIHRILIWYSIEELAPHDALFWPGWMRYHIIFKHKKRPLTIQGCIYEANYTELTNYVCPITNVRNLPPFSKQEACKCQILVDFNPNPESNNKYFLFRNNTGSFRIGKKVTQILLYNPWGTGSVFLNSEEPIHLLTGANVICICFFKYRFQKLRNSFGDNNTYNITLIGGPLHRLVRIRTTNKNKAYFIFYKKFHTCDNYASSGEVPTLLELSKSALITGNINYSHKDFLSFKNNIPRPVTLPPVYPLHVRLQYFDYLFYQFNECSAQCHSCTAQKINHFLPISNNRFDTGNCS